MPVRPPMVNRPMKPRAYSIGVFRSTDPLYIVAVQLKTLMADGMAMMKLRMEKIMPEYTDCPDRNMWWPQTRKPTMAIIKLLKATIS